MKTATQKFKLPKELRHIELGKTLVKKELYQEAFDHFKQSIEENDNHAIDILTFLYKKQIQNNKHIGLNITISKVYLLISMQSEAFDCLEETLEENQKSEIIYDELSKLITKKSLRSRIKKQLEIAFNQHIYYTSIITVLPKLYLEEKNYNKAINFYLQLINIFPEEFSYYKILSELYFRKRDYEEASKILSQLIQLAPYKSEELIKPIQQIIEKTPRHATIRILYANILFKAFKPMEGCKQIEILIKYHSKKTSIAIDILKEQTHAFPDNPDILYLLSDLLIEIEMYTESLGHIQKLIHHHQSYSDKCLLLMQKIIHLYPTHYLALELIGHIYYQQENFHQAFHYFNQCIDISDDPKQLNFSELLKPILSNPDEPTQYKATLLMAKIHAKSSEEEQALKLIEILQGSEETIEAKQLLVSILNKNQQFNESLIELNTLLTKHPFHWDIHNCLISTFKDQSNNKINQLQSTNTASTETLIKIAIEQMAQSQYNKAIEILQNIPQDNSTTYENGQRLIARCYFELSRFDLTEQIHQRIIKNTDINNTLKECHYWAGLSQLLLSNTTEAIQCFETVETVDRQYLNTQLILESLRKNKFLNHHGLVLIGCTSFFNQHFQLSIKNNHFGTQKKKSHQFEVIGFAQSYNDEGCKQVIKQQLKAGHESFKLAIQMDPKFHISYVNLGLLYILENNINEALEVITKAESITTNCPYTYLMKGLCYLKKNDPDQAIKNIQQSLKIHPNESLFHINLGDIFFKQHQIELAINFWEKATPHLEYHHWIQQRYRVQHFDKLNLDYWMSPDYLCLR